MLVSAALGSLLLALAVPAVGPEISRQLALPAVLAAESGRSVDLRALRRAAVKLEAAADAGTTIAAWRDAGRARVELARAAGDAAEAPTELTAAAADLRAGLALAPGDPYGWNRLAHVEYRRRHFVEAAGAWRLSVATGAFDPVLMFTRVEGGLALWPYMDLPARAAFAGQLAVHWRWGPDGLAELLHRFAAGPIALQALADHPAIAADLAERLKRRRAG